MKNRTNWIQLFQKSFCIAGIAVLLAISAGTAAELKDVRIGDYDNFTRVVFEFSAAVKPLDFGARLPGQLSIKFAETIPRLIRKIPFDRSPQINDAQIWQEGHALAVVLYFPFDRFRFEHFALSEPERIVIDIFPIADIPAGPDATNQNSIVDRSNKTTGKSNVPLSPVAEKQIVPSLANPPAPESSSPATETFLGQVVPPGLDSKQMVDEKIPQPGINAELPILNNTVDSAVQRALPRGSFTGRLQYYLVIGLVIITIAILGLLVLMLLTRYKNRNTANPMATSEYLQRQDETIASLNARIQEQLKRYDEA